MKLYRSLEFSKLIWLASEESRSLWIESDMLYYENKNDKSSNWWLDPTFENKRRYIISDICKNQTENFFSKSLEYNAMQGGRFNPTKSFGTLYSSTHPLVSALEVIYHQFHDIYPLYTRMNSNRRKFTSSFNFEIPQKLDLIITTFEFEVKDNIQINGICEDIDELISMCKKVGFERYIGEDFSRDFIFGNDYEISRLIGCQLHSLENSSFKVPSARISFDLQDELNIRNYAFPEKEYNSSDFKLTGKFYEYRVNLDLQLDEKQHHKVSVKILGDSENEIGLSFYLEPKPNRKRNSKQFIRYKPTANDPINKSIYFREVEIQKFTKL